MSCRPSGRKEPRHLTTVFFGEPDGIAGCERDEKASRDMRRVRATFKPKGNSHPALAAISRTVAARARRLRVRCGAARRFADAALVRARPRHALVVPCIRCP